MGNELPFVRKAVEEFHGEGKEAIDFGCGYGRNVLFLAESGFNVTAVDKCKDCLDKIKKDNNKINTVNADLAEYNFKNYDFMLCTFVLHFFERKVAKRIVKEMSEKLNKSGILAIALIKEPGKLSSDELMNSVLGLTTVSFVEKTVHDEPHTGAEYPHDHEIVFYIGRK